ncbi:L-rhamnose mutarotase [Butyrivibrio sp. VCB2001]|uniref:L-rhamnose mutarotase n=1 Tax=Butyrivibrio sp. VCB2001 TaxID=1280667 RepID=UPI000410AAE0|nr:L-rhamnose mutarotase [Butyrivibrio sp. VCB2001]
MERYAWKGMVLKGKKDEYIKRHDEIWPEMVEVLKAAGICNYSIYMYELDDAEFDAEVFGYYECEKGIEYAGRYQAESEVVDRWDESMKGILILEKDEKTGAQKQMKQVFRLD